MAWRGVTSAFGRQTALPSFIESIVRRLRGKLSLPGRFSRAPREEVREGMAFARLLTPGVTESVQVSEVINDGSGNPHIRFAVKVRDQNSAYDEGSRVLALKSFLEQYRRVG